MNLELTKIRRDDSAQPRAMLNTDHIKDLADALEDERDLTPVDVFYDGHSYWLADGLHRYSAYHRAKRDEIPVNVHGGDLRDAVLYSITVNAKHATLKLTREEKRAGVARLLKDKEWGQWSDSEIGRRAGVDHKTVSKLRGDLGIPRSDVRKGADGRTINISNIGKPKSADDELPTSDQSQVTAPQADVPEYTQPRHLKTYSPPLTPEEPEEDDRLEYQPPEDENIDDEPFDLSVYPRPAPKSSTADIRVKPPDPSKQRPFMRAFLAAGAFNRLSDEVMVKALLSPENKTPQEGALEQEFEIAMDKMRRCMAQAEIERRTVTA